MNDFSTLELTASGLAMLATAALVVGVRVYLSRDRADWFSEHRRHFWLQGSDGTRVSFLLHEDETLDDGVSRALYESDRSRPVRRTAAIG